MAGLDRLFSTGRIGRLETKNRLIMAPMVRNYADAQGFVTPGYIAHIERIARGGVGAMILEASFVTPEGKGFANELGLHTDAAIPGLQKLADVAHAGGAVIGPQIFHGGRQAPSAVSGFQPLAPSAVPDPTVNELPRAMTLEDIERTIEAFAATAERVRHAGCDFVELHGAHGYLITQFLSPFSNYRQDEYGGSPEKRMRFMEEVFQAVRGRVGPDFPITVRLSGEEMVPGGLTIDDTAAIARRLEEIGADALHISAGNYASYNLGCMISPMAVEDAPLVHLAQQVREKVGIPVIAVDKIRYPQIAEEVLASGKADFIAIGRSLLADPDWPLKAREGRFDEINHCIACNQGCITRLFAQQDVWCTVNPQTSREIEFARPAPEKELRLLVVGGGPGGMTAARVAAERGHKVVLCEELDHLGGQLIAAAEPPHRPGWKELMDYLIREMERLGVEVRLNTAVDRLLVEREKFDAAIIATGAHAIRLNLPGMIDANVAVGRDLLEKRARAKGRVVVAGGGCAGAQTAEYLAEQGHDTTVVEMLGNIAEDAPSADRELLLERLHKLGVKIMTETKIMSLGDTQITVEGPEGVFKIPDDTVVMCLGSASNDGVAGIIGAAVPMVNAIGDAVSPRKVTEAVMEGALAALAL